MTHGDKPGAVFDCNIFFQATRNANGPAAKALRLLEAGGFRLFVSHAVMEEIRETFEDLALRRKNRWLTDGVVAAFFQYLGERAVLVEEVPERYVCERDPDDAKYVNLALAAKATYLVTRDKDLLDLMDETTPAGKQFREAFPQLTILDPVSFFEALRKKSGPEVPAQGRPD